MDNIERIIGYFGQMTWDLAKKTTVYAIVFALVIFLQGFIPSLPQDLFLVDGEALMIATKTGLALVYKQILIVATPFIISLARTDKK